MKKNRIEREHSSAGDGRLEDSLERQLKVLWQAPAPERRDAFLAGSPPLPISHSAFVLSQAAYIRKRVWALSVAIFAALVGITAGWQRDALCVAAGAMPFLALIAAQEQTRSSVYNMTELEFATRFSVKSIVLARMGLLGSFHLALLLLLLPLLALYEQMKFWHTGVYLLVPYLMTTFLSMVWSRKVRGREAMYLCLGNAVLVGCLQFVGYGMFEWYMERFFGCWIAALALLLAANGWEYYQAACRTNCIYERAAAGL